MFFLHVQAQIELNLDNFVHITNLRASIINSRNVFFDVHVLRILWTRGIQIFN